MRRTFARIVTAAAIAAGALVAGVGTAQSSGLTEAEDAAYFEFTDYTGEVAVVTLTETEKIAHARALLNGETHEEPHLTGRIVKSTAEYNQRWSFHLSPESVRFFEMAIEVCDASIPYVEDHVDEVGGAFLPGSYWCPWTSRLVREVPAP